MTTPPRKAIHAYLTDGAHDHWHDNAARLGTDVSALLEAIAPTLEAILHTDPAAIAARNIAATRRRRKRAA